MDRREFVKTTAGATAWTALSASRILGANDRIGLALIGCGGRGRQVAPRRAVGAGNVEYRTMCDVWDRRPQEASKELADGKATTAQGFPQGPGAEGHRRRAYRYAGSLARDACRAGLPGGQGRFVEKPMTLTIREGQAVVAAARQNKRMVMVGTQHRSAPHIAEAAKIAQSGVVGDIYYVRVWNSGQGGSESRGGSSGLRSARGRGLGYVPRPGPEGTVQPAAVHQQLPPVPGLQQRLHHRFRQPPDRQRLPDHEHGLAAHHRGGRRQVLQSRTAATSRTFCMSPTSSRTSSSSTARSGPTCTAGAAGAVKA